MVFSGCPILNLSDIEPVDMFKVQLIYERYMYVHTVCMKKADFLKDSILQYNADVEFIASLHLVTYH